MVRVRRLLMMESWRLQAVPLAAALAAIEQQGAPAPRNGTNFARAWQAIDETISTRASQKYCVVFLSDGRPAGMMRPPPMGEEPSTVKQNGQFLSSVRTLALFCIWVFVRSDLRFQSPAIGAGLSGGSAAGYAPWQQAFRERDRHW